MTQFLELRLINPLKQHLVVGVRINRNLVQWVQLACTVKHVLIHLSVLATKTAVENPIVKAPGINKTHSMRPDFLEQAHDGIGACQADLLLAACTRCVELRTLLLERVQCEQTEKLHEYIEGLAVNGGRGGDLLQRGEVRLHDHVLRVCFAQAVEIDKQVVPGLLLLVAVLRGLEGEEGHTPCIRSDEVLIRPNDIKRATNFAARLEFGQDLGSVVGGLFTVENGTGRFKELGMLETACIPKG
jgi:hypothetical protein